jgi:uncharacterized membrane protein YhaH (DUF805 family)
VSAASVAAVQASAWASLISFLILAYPGYAISVKRRHDRGNSGLDVLVYMAVTALLLLIQALGLGMTSMDVEGVVMPVPSMPLTLAFTAIGIFAIYLLVALGFLRGTAGTNSHGADPLGGGSAVAA